MNPYPNLVELLNQNPVLVFIIGVWSLIWKGFALWRASQRKEKVWFIVLLIFNTIGLLEILYLFVFSKGETKPKRREEKQEGEEEKDND